MTATSTQPIMIKKYANRRLYNTATSTYITLEQLGEMVKAGVDFVVQDAKTSEDITRQVLTQIIFELEGSNNLLPTNFLRQLIGFYGDSMQSMVSRYLEATMVNFVRNQDQLRHYWQDTMTNFFPFTGIEPGKVPNMGALQQTMKMFNPFTSIPGAVGTGSPMDGLAQAQLQAIQMLQQQLQDMQKKMDALQGVEMQKPEARTQKSEK